MVIVEEDARTKLAPHQGVFVAAIHDAFLEWDREYATTRIDHSKRTQSSLMHDLIVKHLRLEFGSSREVRVTEVRGRQVVVVADEIVLSVKKLDASHRTSSIPTIQARAFLEQGYIEGLPPATKMNLGYEYNDTRTGWESIWVTCPNNATIGYEWRLDLAQDVLDLPVAEIETSTKRRLKRKVRHVSEDMDDAADPSS